MSSMATKKVPTKARSAAKKTAKPAKKPAITQKVSKTGASISVEGKPASPRPVADKLAAIGIEAICECIAGGESLRAWSIRNGYAQRSVLDWIEVDEKRSTHYARAREDRADAVFDSLDAVSAQAAAAKTAVEVAGLRLMADNMKWKLARMNAKKYGDKLGIGQAEDLKPLTVVVKKYGD